jgi:tRNA pseudouridine38-40 synthase
VRRVEEIAFQYHGQRLRISVRGPNFLYRMVRNLVGTIIDIGRAKIAENSLPQLFTSRDRTRAGVTAPAHGLQLYKIFY